MQRWSDCDCTIYWRYYVLALMKVRFSCIAILARVDIFLCKNLFASYLKPVLGFLQSHGNQLSPNCSDAKEFFSFIVVYNFRQFQRSLARAGCGIFTNGQCSEHNYVISAISLQPRRWCIARLMVKGSSKLTIKFCSLL